MFEVKVDYYKILNIFLNKLTKQRAEKHYLYNVISHHCYSVFLSFAIDLCIVGIYLSISSIKALAINIKQRKG